MDIHISRALFVAGYMRSEAACARIHNDLGLLLKRRPVIWNGKQLAIMFRIPLQDTIRARVLMAQELREAGLQALYDLD